MRHALAEASWHVAHRSAFGARLADQPLMQNVVADLAVESEAATALAIRLAAAVDAERRPPRGRAAPDRAAAGEVLGLQAHPAASWPRRWSASAATGTSRSPGCRCCYRESPLNSIWEGSGNVNALDVLRALSREPEVLAAWITEVGRARGGDARLDRAIDDTLALLGETGVAGGRSPAAGGPDGRLPAGVAAGALRARRRSPTRSAARASARRTTAPTAP